MKCLAALLLIASTSFLIAACGGENSSSASAESTAQAYVDSQRQGDWESFCDLLTAKSQEAIQSQLLQADKSKAGSCSAAVNGASKKTQNALRKAASAIEISDVAVKGDKALLTAVTPDGNKTLEMVNEDGSWRVALVP